MDTSRSLRDQPRVQRTSDEKLDEEELFLRKLKTCGYAFQ